jgi:hypothetical protein
VSNPFKLLIAVAIVIGIVLSAGFTYMVFLREPGTVLRFSDDHSVIEPA